LTGTHFFKSSRASRKAAPKNEAGKNPKKCDKMEAKLKTRQLNKRNAKVNKKMERKKKQE
jgi:hypothetical protein